VGHISCSFYLSIFQASHLSLLLNMAVVRSMTFRISTALLPLFTLARRFAVVDHTRLYANHSFQVDATIDVPSFDPGREFA